jgi:hypothetical protein
MWCVILALAAIASMCSAVPHIVKKHDPSHGDFALATKDSEGFFDDIREADWKMLRQRHHETNNYPRNEVGGPGAPSVWYQLNFEPTFTCAHEIRLGGNGDGPKW